VLTRTDGVTATLDTRTDVRDAGGLNKDRDREWILWI
jgi:hypothetical protein